MEESKEVVQDEIGNVQNELISVPEAARLFGVSVTALNNVIKRGKIPVVLQLPSGSRKRLVSKQAVLDYKEHLRNHTR